jgi:hypothetical protein
MLIAFQGSCLRCLVSEAEEELPNFDHDLPYPHVIATNYSIPENNFVSVIRAA